MDNIYIYTINVLKILIYHDSNDNYKNNISNN